MAQAPFNGSHPRETGYWQRRKPREHALESVGQGMNKTATERGHGDTRPTAARAGASDQTDSGHPSFGRAKV